MDDPAWSKLKCEVCAAQTWIVSVLNGFGSGGRFITAPSQGGGTGQTALWICSTCGNVKIRQT